VPIEALAESGRRRSEGGAKEGYTLPPEADPPPEDTASFIGTD